MSNDIRRLLDEELESVIGGCDLLPGSDDEYECNMIDPFGEN